MNRDSVNKINPDSWPYSQEQECLILFEIIKISNEYKISSEISTKLMTSNKRGVVVKYFFVGMIIGLLSSFILTSLAFYNAFKNHKLEIQILKRKNDA